MELYDPATNTWEAVAPMSTKRMLLGAASIDGKLYAVGGHDGSARLTTWSATIQRPTRGGGGANEH